MGLYNPPKFQITSSAAATIEIDSATTSATLLEFNPARKGALIWNDSTSNLLIDFDASVSLTSFIVRIYPDGYYELPFGYTGVISGIWETANGKASIREFT